MEEQMTESQVRKIAREEALKVQKEVLKEISDVKATLARLERLLLGEMGTNEEDTLKSRANVAYLYAKKNIEAKIIERAEPALDWFEDMNTPDKGCVESKLDILGKMITGWTSIKWGLGVFGIVNLATLISLGLMITNILRVIKELGL
jgi:hypothetical protein